MGGGQSAMEARLDHAGKTGVLALQQLGLDAVG